jgi:uncharacterized protein YneF (UPF0154 family)
MEPPWSVVIGDVVILHGFTDDLGSAIGIVCGLTIGITGGILWAKRRIYYKQLKAENLNKEVLKSHAEEMQVWEKAYTTWEKCYYCRRDDIVFVPGISYTNAGKIHELLMK